MGGSDRGIEQGKLYRLLLGQAGPLRGNEIPQQAVRGESETVRHSAGSGQEVLGPFHDDPQLRQAFNVKGACPPGGQDAPGLGPM